MITNQDDIAPIKKRDRPKTIDAFAMVTGHRQLDGYYYDPHDPVDIWVDCYDIMVSYLTRFDPEHTVLISGMAIGVDHLWVEVGIDAGFTVDAYIPCHGQSNRWPDATREHYMNLRDRCRASGGEIIYCTNDEYVDGCMNTRNLAMLLNATHCLGIFNGVHRGGTYNCILSARHMFERFKRPDITIWNPNTGELM